METQTWIQISADSDFSYHNIPFGVFSTACNKEDARPATRVGDFIIDLREAERQGLLNGELFSKLSHKVFQGKTLNSFMELTRPHWQEVRRTIQSLLHVGSALDTNKELQSKVVIPYTDKIILHLPAQIGDYTDFYSSYTHAYNVGVMFRGKDNAIQPNWLHIPIGYHGRASTVVVSGTDIHRPRGQAKPPTAEKPIFTECKRLDYELEVAAFVGGPANKMGEPVKVDSAEDRVFGFVLMNDWSARDHQAWEYVPLGPFNGKNFGTTISPWIVTLDALEMFRVDLEPQNPEPLPYLKEKRHTSWDINLEVYLHADGNTKADILTKSNYKYMYWNIAQQLTHHSVGGCILNAGDLLASGTISGPQKHEFGSMLELSWQGTEKIALSEGKERTFIQDNDQIIMKGFAEKNGIRVGFGECAGKVLPALPENKYY
ncbi:fumarylacetoacetase (macronuclear) [Tetrahymena thermophila SB210]|uniref:Fumarylacetoacetase n=1 Tax=Tetrahymena thermophila (strain SB210) TaxID=312017 RepID=Q23DU3_TETTS|nr:fumarylacetoacetase [Tetrahymena thermophila SB210]EAR94691.1 fumarylacetoacetase [Tetrahymena thermophila SB210]|eukprot:XP_001014593.1 fumarylacetoacetase [Tetrahymena thermophila SB210]